MIEPYRVRIGKQSIGYFIVKDKYSEKKKRFQCYLVLIPIVCVSMCGICYIYLYVNMKQNWKFEMKVQSIEIEWNATFTSTLQKIIVSKEFQNDFNCSRSNSIVSDGIFTRIKYELFEEKSILSEKKYTSKKKWFDRYYKLINRIKADWLGLESICMATVIGVLHVRGWKFIWRSAIDWKLIAIICIHRACTYFPHTTANGSLVQLNCKINYSRWFFNLLPRLPSRLLR